MHNILKNNLNLWGIYTLITLLVLLSTGQLSHIYVEHDDWHYMTTWLSYLDTTDTPFNRMLMEGRWINYLWSFVAQKLSIEQNYFLFLGLYNLFCWGIACLLTSSRYQLLIAFALFFMPQFGQLSLWPATLTPMLIIGIIIVLMAHYKIKEYYFIIPFITLMLSYPPLLAFLLPILAYQYQSPKSAVKFVAIFCISYLLGVLLMYTLNGYYHNYFGIKIAESRSPNPLNSGVALEENLSRLWKFYTESFWRNLVPLVFAFFLSFWLNSKHILKIGLIALFLFIQESSLILYTGVDIPERSQMWTWISFILIALPLLQQSKWKLWIGIAYLGYLVLSGAYFWSTHYISFQKYANFEYYLSGMTQLHHRRQILLCGQFQRIEGQRYKALQPISLILSIYKRTEVQLIPVRGNICKQTDQVGFYRSGDYLIYQLDY
ncbi:hypothetical protein [Rodentibacter haemolyticus]|uniref:Glycosyltransferase RgtA/B/C/D-like domain-containing protein n=1 Tax=Rodentibacter haemolyticus TaxID=2778911 RepID=A0ABX6UYD1_9PAST|nr:hypothetical protein [Rodentibacter haemolyticus]QPB42479.1 hypothetical protein IHV77_11370 [Rodentibacter haemolyticus]